MALRHFAKAVRLACPEPATLDTPTLWHWHRMGERLFWQQAPGEGPTRWLDLKHELAWRQLTDCEMCHWRCKIDRTTSARGRCGVGEASYLTAEYLHMGEEPEITPAHTLFFSGCTFRCVYCQNWRGAFNARAGRPFTAAEVADLARHRQKQGAVSLNLVGGTPEPHLHFLIQLADHLSDEVWLPIVLNGNASATPDAIRLMTGIVDLHLLDFKFGNRGCGEQVAGIPNYWEQTTQTIRQSAETGGLLIRHLVMPGHLPCCTRPVLDWLAREMPSVRLHLMDQYRPAYKAWEDPKLKHHLTKEDYWLARAWAAERGLSNVLEPPTA